MWKKRDGLRPYLSCLNKAAAAHSAFPSDEDSSVLTKVISLTLFSVYPSHSEQFPISYSSSDSVKISSSSHRSIIGLPVPSGEKE